MADLLFKQKPPKVVLCPQSRSAPAWYWSTPTPELERLGLNENVIKSTVTNINEMSEKHFTTSFNTSYRWLVYIGPIGILVGIILIFALMGVRIFYVSIVICFPSVVMLLGGFIMLYKGYNEATDGAMKKVENYVTTELTKKWHLSRGIKWSMEIEEVPSTARGHEIKWNHIAVTIDRTIIAPAVAGVSDNAQLHPIPVPSHAVDGENSTGNDALRLEIVAPEPSPVASSVSHSTPL